MGLKKFFNIHRNKEIIITLWAASYKFALGMGACNSRADSKCHWLMVY